MLSKWFRRAPSGPIRTRKHRPIFDVQQLEDRATPTIAYAALGDVYSQNFNTLPNTAVAASTSGFGTGPYALNGAPMNWTGVGTGDWYYSATGTPAQGSGTGSSANGGLYAFGTNADRALGTLITGGTSTQQFGALFVNNTGSTIRSVTLTFNGEHWRREANAGTYSFSFATGAGLSLASGTTGVASGNFAGLSTGGGAALDGNLVANRRAVATTFAVNWQAGENLLIRWNDADESGSDDASAIDDVTLTAGATTQANTVYVDDSFPASGPITDLDGDQAGNQAGTAGVDGFQTIQEAVDALGEGGGVILVQSGSYTNLPVILPSNVQLTIAGAVTVDDLKNANVTVNSGATVTVNTTATLEYTGLVSGGGGLGKAGSGTLILQSTQTYTGPTTVSDGVLQIGNANALGNLSALTTVGLTSATATLTFNRSDSYTFANTITGSGSVTQAFAGILTLSGTSTYTGSTNISAGSTIRIGSVGTATTGPLGSNTGSTIVASGGVLDLNGFAYATTRTVTLNGTGISGGGALVNSSGTAATYAGALALGSAATITASSGNMVLSSTSTITGATFGLTLNGTNAASSLAGLIGTTTGTVTKSGAGTWTLTNAGNTYSGITSVLGGVLAVASTGTPINLNGGQAGSYLGSSSAAAGNLVIDGGNLRFAPGATGRTYNTDRVLTIGTSGATLSTVSDTTTVNLTAAALDFSGTGPRTLTVASGNAGSAFVFQGVISDSPDMGATTLAASFTNGTTTSVSLTVTGTNTHSGPTTLTSATSTTNNFIQIGNGGATGTLGASAVSGSGSANNQLRFNRNNAFVFGNSVSGTIGLSQVGVGGTTTVEGNNTHTGTNSVVAGTLVIGSATALGNTANALTLSGGTLDLNAFTPTVGTLTLSGPATLQGGSITGTSYVGSNASGNASVTANLLANGAAGLAKSGAGTLTLSGTNTFTGATNVTAGTLALTGGAALSNSSAVSVSSGATLNVQTAETIGALSLGGTLSVALGATPLVAVNGTVTLTNALLSLSGSYAPLVGETMTIIENDNTDAVIGTLSGVPEGGKITFNGMIFQVSYAGGTDSNDVTLTRLAGNVFYVDDSFTNPSDADPVAPGNQSYTIGVNAFTTVNAAVAAAVAGDAIIVNAGTYAEAVSISAGLFVFLQENSSTFNSLASTGAATLSIGAGVTLSTNSTGNASTTFTGSLAGPGALTKLGSGTLTLTVSGLHGGATAITGGVIVNTTADFAYAGTISGAGTLEKQGASALTLGGANGYTGASTITNGTVIATHATSFGTTAGGITVGNGATLDIRAAIGAEAVGLFGTASIITGSGVGSLSGAVTLNASTNTVGGDGTLTISGNVTGGFALTKIGTGATTFTGTANTYSGGLTIKSGTFVAGHATAPGTIGITLGSSTGSSASLLANGVTVTNAINLGTGAVGTLTIGNNGGSTAAVFNGAITLNGNPLTIAPSGTGSVTLGGGITGTGNLTINNGTTTATTAINTNPVNNVGTITNSGTGTGTTTINAAVGSNVTAIIENSATSGFSIVGALTVNSGGTTITNNNVGGGSLVSIVTSIGGSGNLILNNNSGIANGVTINASVNNVGTVTNSGTGAGSTLIQGVIGTNVTGVVQNSATSTLSLTTSANTFTSGLSVRAGTVSGTVANSFGANANVITLGHSSGSANVTIIGAGSVTHANPISVASGNTGVVTITSTGTAIFGGAITLNSHDVTIGSSNTNLLTISGGITGTGNVTVAAASSGGTTIQTGAVNMTGTITNSGTGSGLTTISSAIGSNVTAITENSATSALTISGAVTVNGAGTTITNANASGSSVLTISTGGIGGTGNLILNNNSAIASGISITGAVNNVGTVTNSGTGAGATLISGVIGTNVTGVIQNSATSALNLTTSANTFTSGLSIRAGTVSGNVVNSFGANGNVITLGHSSGSANVTLIGGVNGTFAQPINVASGNTGIVTISSSINSPTFNGGINLVNHDVVIAPAGNHVIVSGGITGTGNVTIATTGAGTTTIQTALVNMVGTITNAGTGVGLTTISAAIGSNVTAITENSATSALTISGAVTVNSGGMTITNNNASGSSVLTVSTGGITGTGNLTLNNNSAIASGITVSATVNNVGTVTNSGTGTGSTLVSGVVGTNVTGVTQNSPTSTLAFTTAANTYTSGLAVRAGTVSGAVANSFGANANVITLGHSSGSANVALVGAGAVTFANPISVANGNSGTATISSTANAVFSGAITLNTHALLLAPAAATLAISGGITGTGNVTIATTGVGTTTIQTAPVNMTGSITNSGTGTGTTTISSVIGTNVTGVLQNSATSQLTLSGTNTFSSGITIQAGILSVGLDAHLGAAANPVVFDGGTLQVTGTTLTGFGSHVITFTTGKTVGFDVNGAANTFTVSQALTHGAGGVTKLGAGTLVLSNPGNTYQGATTITAGTLSISETGNLGDAATPIVFDGGTFRVTGTTFTSFGTHVPTFVNGKNVGIDVNAAGNTFTLSEQLNQGSGSLIKSGAGGLTLTNVNNTFTGGTKIGTSGVGGTLTVGATNAIGSGVLDVQGGTLDLGIFNCTVSGITSFSNWTSATTINGTGTLTFGTAGGAAGVNLGWSGNSTPIVVNVKLSGTGKLLRNAGPGLVSLTNPNNDFTGGLDIGAGGSTGALNFVDGALGSGTITFINSGLASLQWATGNTVDLSSRIVINNGSVAQIDTNGNNVAFANALGAGSTGGLLKTGAGTLTLNAANLYTGLTTVSGGTLAYGLSDVVSTGGITVNGGILDMGTFSDTVGTVTLNAGSILGSGTLTSTSGFVANNPGAFPSPEPTLVGAVGLAKSAAGTLTLTGANTYTGQTTITGGVLSVNGIKNVGALSSPLGAPATPATGTIGIGGTLSYTGTGDVTDRVLNFTGAAVLDQSGSGLLKFISNNTGANGLTLQGSTTGIGEISGTLTTNSLLKTGTGKWTLSGIGSTMTGNMTFSNGMLVLSGTNTPTMGTLTVNNNGLGANGWLEVPTGASYKFSAIAVTGSNNVDNSGIHLTGGTIESTGAFTMSGGNGTTLRTTTVSGGTLTIGTNMRLGDGGGSGGAFNNQFVQSGGTVTVGTTVDVGKFGTAGNGLGQVLVSGGSFTSGGAFFLKDRITNSNETDLIMGGGSVTVNDSTTGLQMGADSNTGNGRVFLAGGVLSAHKVLKNSTTTTNANYNTIFFNGGTLRALSNNTTFLGALATPAGGNNALGNSTSNVVFVYSGGATVDTNGFNVTINPSLVPRVASTLSSVASVTGIAPANAGSNYAIAPNVSFTGGGGSGATGYATLNTTGGIAAIVITDPGTGYTSAPTVVLSGGTLLTNGGVAADPSLWTVNLRSATAGGLTKTGSGTLTLANANTYTGETTISAGTLALGSLGTLAASTAVTVGIAPASTAVFDVTAVSGGTYNVPSGQTIQGEGTVLGNLNFGAGSKIGPGNSAGALAQTGNATYGPSASYVWQVNQADGTIVAGNWDWHNISGTLDIQATSGSPFVIDIGGLNPSNVPGVVANWDPHGTYSWTIATAAGGIVNFAADKFSFTTTNFANNNSVDPTGFSMSVVGNDLVLSYAGAGAATTYWDVDGATLGAGGATPSGTWATTAAANWSPAANGSVATANWVNGDNATFSAGSGATGAYTATISGGVIVHDVTVTSGAVTIAGSTLTLTGASPTITVNSPQSLTISSTIADVAAAGLTKAGSGTLALSGTNTYTGTTTINAGTLQAANAAALPSYLIPGNTLAAGATLALSVGGMGGWASSEIDSLRSNTTFANNTAILALDTTAGDFSYASAIANGLTLYKLGPNVLTLGGASTYSGVTAIKNGTIALGVDNALPAGTVLTLGDAATNESGKLQLSDGTTSRNQTLAGLLTAGTGTANAVTGGGSTLSTLTLNLATNNVYGGLLGGAGTNDNALALTQAGAGTLTLTGANTFAGKTTITNGIVSVSSLNSVNGGTPLLASSGLGAPLTIADGTIDLGSLTTVGQLTYTGSGETTDRVLNLAGANFGGTIDQSGSGLLKFTSNVTATGNGTKILTLQGSGAGELSGTISDSAGATQLAKNGTGTWTLSGTGSTMTGAIGHNNGMLVLKGTNTSTLSTINVANGGNAANGWLEIAPGASYTAISVNVNSAGANGVLHQTGGSLTTTGAFSVGSGTVGAPQHAYMTGGTLTIGAGLAVKPLSGAGSNQSYFNMSGGVVTVQTAVNLDTNQNSQLSLTVMSGGTLTSTGAMTLNPFQDSSSFLIMGGTAGVTVNSVTGIQIGGQGVQNRGPGQIYLTGNSVLQAHKIFKNSITVPAISPSTVFFNGGTLKASSTNNTDFLGPLATPGGGNNALGDTFSAVKNYVTVFSGGATIDSNGFDVTINPALMPRPTNTVGTQSVATVSGLAPANAGSGYSIVPNVGFSGGGGSGASGFATLNSDGGIAAIVITDPGTGYTSAPTVTLSGGILGPGGVAATPGSWTVSTRSSTAGGLTKQGAGVLTLASANLYTGPTLVSAGTIKAGNNGALGNLSAVTVSSPAFLVTNGFNPTIGSLAGAGTVRNTHATNNSLLTVGGDNTSTTFSGLLEDGGAGTLALTKAGSGTMSLSGANSYSGGTTVSGGTLSADNATGSATGSGSVTVDASGALAGIGFVAGPVTVNGSLAPGNAGIGALTINGAGTGLTLAGTANFEVNASSVTNDEAVVVGDLTYGGELKIVNLAGTIAPGQVYDLFDFGTRIGMSTFSNDASFNGVVDYAGTDLPSLAGTGYKYVFNYTTGELSIVANATQLVVTSTTIVDTTYGTAVQFTVEARTSGGALVPSFTGLVTLTVMNSSFVNNFDFDMTAMNGEADFEFVYLAAGNGVSITASASGLTPAVSNTFNVPKKNVTVVGVFANSKDYDGGTTTSGNSSFADIVGEAYTDVLAFDSNLTFDTYEFDDPNVGTDKPVTVSGFVLENAGISPANNYILIQPQGVTANINATVSAPTVTSITPFIGPTTGGNVVVIVGTDFTDAYQIAFKNHVITTPAFTVNSATQITATVPSNLGAVELVDVTVTTPAGGSSSTVGTGDDYSYATPSVTSVVPNGVPVQTLTGATWASGNPLVTVASTSGLAVGAQVSSFGAGFPAYATVLSVDSGTTFTLSSAPSSTQGTATTIRSANVPKKSGTVQTLTGATWTNGGTSVTVASTTGLLAGQFVTAAGLPTDATIASITDAFTFVLSSAATADQLTPTTIAVANAAIARDQYGGLTDVGGSNAGSVIQNLLVTFNQKVTLDAGAFAIANLGASVSTNSAVPATGDVTVVAIGVLGTGDDATGYTQYVLNFVAGSAVNSFTNAATTSNPTYLGNAFTTLKNSLFRLDTVGSKVHAGSDTGANGNDNFWSLYGAVNPSDIFITGTPGGGNDEVRVDGIALSDTYATFGSFANLTTPPYNRSFDGDLDGDVDGIDLTRLYGNFGTIWSF